MDGDARNPLEGRYGRASRSRRGPLIAAAATGIAIAMAWAIWAGLGRSNKDITWQVVSFNTHATSVDVTFRLHRKHNVPVDCVVAARAKDGREVGRATVTVPPSRRATVTTVYPLQTSAPPVIGEIKSCSASPGE